MESDLKKDNAPLNFSKDYRTVNAEIRSAEILFLGESNDYYSETADLYSYNEKEGARFWS